jgi:hypothetical protein
MKKTTLKKAIIGGLITGACAGCAELKADLKARDGVHMEMPGTNSKLVEIDLKDLIVKMDKLQKVVEANAKVTAKLIDRSNQSRQQVATSQPVSAGRDARTINPVVTVSGDNSPILIITLAILATVVAGKLGMSWLKSRRSKAEQSTINSTSKGLLGRFKRSLTQAQQPVKETLKKE